MSKKSVGKRGEAKLIELADGVHLPSQGNRTARRSFASRLPSGSRSTIQDSADATSVGVLLTNDSRTARLG
jgi:hypothetical protein